MKKALIILVMIMIFTGTTMASPPVVVTDFIYPIEAPENAAVDLCGNIYVSLSLDGTIMKVKPDGTQEVYAQLPFIPGCSDPLQFMTGITIDIITNEIHVNALSCDLDARGIYIVYPPDQPGELAEFELLARFPAEASANGVTRFMGQLYTVDSFLGYVYRIPEEGVDGEYADVWFYDERLEPGPPNPIGIVPGANGIQRYGLKLYVSNSSKSTFLTIPLEFNSLYDFIAGTPDPGEMEVYATIDGPGPDDFAFDIFGSIYYGTDPFNTVVRLDRDGVETVLLDTDTDCITNTGTRKCVDGATAVVFDRWTPTIYITMAAFAFFPNKGTPSLVSLPNVAWGYPGR